jgi:Zn-dependent protease with chaperone function
MTVPLPEAREYSLPTFADYVAGRTRAPGRVTPAYAHPMDRAIIDRLSRSALQHPINRFIELAMDFIFTPLIFNSIPVAARSFPQLNELRAQASATLGIPVPDMYAAPQPQPGTIFTVGTDERAFIFVETTYEHLASREEMLFVIGHECGHIDNQHVTYRTLVALLLDTGNRLLDRHPAMKAMAEALSLVLGPALAAWSRRSEITADRAGLICCRDLQVAQRAFIRLMLGFAKESEIDVEDYIRTMRETPIGGTTARFALMEQVHPVIPVRLQALRLFRDSELYYDVTGLPRPDGPLLSREEMELRVGELIALV